jgi:molybdopterin-guanine dinucleotide biosynthesis protein A
MTHTNYDALILAGGRGTRVNHQDKGLLVWQAHTLVEHMLQILQKQSPAPQHIYISANRNQTEYQNFGHTVLPDERVRFQGPLAGIESVMTYRAKLGVTNPLLVVPCDTPLLPRDLFERLNQSLGPFTLATYAVSPSGMHPLCCLVKVETLASLTEQLNQNQRRVKDWLNQVQAKDVMFETDAHFKNFNDSQVFSGQ